MGTLVRAKKVLVGNRTNQRLRHKEEILAEVRAYDLARPQVTAELKSGKFSTLAEYRARRISRSS